jgi:predicted DNA-binding helix-hairpin-helix protein
LILSSGVVKNADDTMELLVRCGRLLRERHS